MYRVFIKNSYFFINNSFCKEKYLTKLKDNKHLVVLNLHKISREVNSFYPSLSPELFESLLQFISKEFNIITFREIELFKYSKKPNIILSFDDGFYDFFEYAMPLLAKYNIRVNLNIIPQCIETKEPIWDVALGDILNQIPIRLINAIPLPHFKKKLTIFNKNKYALDLTYYLKQKNQEERKELWNKIKNTIPMEKIKLTKMLSKDDIIQISNIHEIGVHSYSHESMALETQEFFENDFLKCKNYFDNILRLPMDIYTFPSGSYHINQFNFLQKNGIQHILLVNEKYASYTSNIHHRFTFYGNSISEIKMRSLGWTH